MGLLENRSPRYWTLDGLRGVCSLAVFFTHWVLGMSFAPAGAVATGVSRTLGVAYDGFVILFWPTGGNHPAVILFFVLSGFCVHGPFERRQQQADAKISWGKYFIRRTRRILPVYWAATLLGLLVVAAQSWRPVTDSVVILHTMGTPAQLAARIFGYAGLWPTEIFLGNPTLATVGVEIVIYLAYPLFFWGARAGQWTLLGGVAIGLHLLAVALRPYLDPFVLFGSVLIMALFWYLGAFAAHLFQSGRGQVRGWALVLVWAAFLGLKSVPHFYGLNLLKQAAWGLFCMMLILWLLRWEARHDMAKNHALSRLLRWLGAVSYSLYAVHIPVILFITWAMSAWISSPGYLWQLFTSLVLCTAFTVAIHYGVEKRFYQPRN